MKTRFLLSALLLVCPILGTMAQSYDELAVMFSNSNPGGTSRIMGLGGAQISLGGDASMVNSNPAGLGMFNKSVFQLTGSIYNHSNISDYYGLSSPEKKVNLNIPGIGVVFHQKGNGKSGFVSGSWGINYSRINNFHQQFRYSGTPDHSIIDSFLDQVYWEENGQNYMLDPNEFQSYGSEYNTALGLGWATYLVDTAYDVDQEELYYFSRILENPTSQRETKNIKGSQNTVNISYGANFHDKVFLGAGIGITSVRFESSSIFEEQFNTASPDYTIKYLQFEEDLAVNGNGINATLGLTVRPVNGVQIGFAYTTPTVYNLNDQWGMGVYADWDGFYYENADFFVS